MLTATPSLCVCVGYVAGYIEYDMLTSTMGIKQPAKYCKDKFKQGVALETRHCSPDTLEAIEVGDVLMMLAGAEGGGRQCRALAVRPRRLNVAVRGCAWRGVRG